MRIVLCVFCGQFFFQSAPDNGKPVLGCCDAISCKLEAVVPQIFTEKLEIASDAVNYLPERWWA